MRHTKEKIENILKEVATGSISYVEGTNLVVAELERVKTEEEDERERQHSIDLFSRLIG